MILPINVLFRARGTRIKAILKNGIKYDGKLEKSDDFMNLLLLDVEEITDTSKIRYPKVFVKGNNILLVELQ